MKRCKRVFKLVLLIYLTLVFGTGVIFCFGCGKAKAVSLNFLAQDGRIKISMAEATCASAPQMVEANGFLFCVYLSSYDNYGEQRDLIALSVIEKSNPEKQETVIAAENGKTVGEELIFYPYEPNILLIGSIARIFFINDSYSNQAYYMYRDYDYKKKEFVSCGRMSVNYKDDIIPFNLENYLYLLNSEKIGIEEAENIYPIFTSKIIYNKEKHYATVTAPLCYPIIVSSKDGFATMEIESIIEYTCEFECAIECFEDKFFVLLRRNGDNFIVYNEKFEAKETYSFETSMTRGQLEVYKDNCLIFYSDHKDKGITYGRCNLKIGLYDVDEKELFLDCYKTSDYNGIVYYSIVIVDDEIHYVYSTTWYYVNDQSKDILVYKKLKIIDFEDNEGDEAV